VELTVGPGGVARGVVIPPGDKSIAHRRLILAALANGPSRLEGLPASGDVVSTALALATLLTELRPPLEGWISESQRRLEGGGFTYDNPQPRVPELALEGRGRRAIEPATDAIDCGNAGTAMRLLAGVLASAEGTFRLTGDASLQRRPMERVAVPLRRMGADVTTADGHAPIVIRGGRLVGARIDTGVPSAQVKGAVLLAGLDAEGVTEVVESVPTRDHTERLLTALGCPLRRFPGGAAVERWEPPGHDGRIPGDTSGALFPIVAALASGGEVTIEEVGLNPTRTAYLEVLSRMGARIDMAVAGEDLGEPLGTVRATLAGDLRGTDVDAADLPLLIDEVPGLAALAAVATGASTFRGAGELRTKESDRLAGIVTAIRALGGHARVEGDDLVVEGGGLSGGTVGSLGDHRLAMAFAAVAPATGTGIRVRDADVAAISYPGYAAMLRSLGLDVEG
jgi:3-phosphoshikimate 1-carboxyvinyltransferase